MGTRLARNFGGCSLNFPARSKNVGKLSAGIFADTAQVPRALYAGRLRPRRVLLHEEDEQREHHDQEHRRPGHVLLLLHVRRVAPLEVATLNAFILGTATLAN